MTSKELDQYKGYEMQWEQNIEVSFIFKSKEIVDGQLTEKNKYATYHVPEEVFEKLQVELDQDELPKVIRFISVDMEYGGFSQQHINMEDVASVSVNKFGEDHKNNWAESDDPDFKGD